MTKLYFIYTILFSALSLLAVSDSPKEEPKKAEILVSEVQIQSGDGFITQDELGRIATNYYKYMFEEEHEWKGIKRKESEKLIKSIIKFKADSLTLAYMVNFNPSGNVLILSNKNYGKPTNTHGSDTWKVDGNEMSIYSKRLHMVIRRMFRDLLDDIKTNNLSKNHKYSDQWEKFLIPPEQFHERASFDDQYPPPDWWLEKKKSKNNKNIEGMIQTEWNQDYP